MLRGYVSHVDGHHSNTGERCKTFAKVIFLVSFWILCPSAGTPKHAPWMQAGSGGAGLGPAAPPAGRAPRLPALAGQGDPRASTRCPRLPSLLVSPRASIPPLCPDPSLADCLCTARPFPQPPRPPASPSAPCPQPPQSPLSSLGPFVPAALRQLGLRLESKPKAVTGAKMEKGAK